MDFNLSQEQLAYRDRVRAWVASALPKALKPPRGGHAESPENVRKRYSAWHKLRYEGGVSCVMWPKEYGG